MITTPFFPMSRAARVRHLRAMLPYLYAPSEADRLGYYGKPGDWMAVTFRFEEGGPTVKFIYDCQPNARRVTAHLIRMIDVILNHAARATVSPYTPGFPGHGVMVQIYRGGEHVLAHPRIDYTIRIRDISEGIPF